MARLPDRPALPPALSAAPPVSLEASRLGPPRLGPSRLGRRFLLGLLGALPATLADAAPVRPAAAPLTPGPALGASPGFPDGATILIAGPDGGAAARWASWLAPLLAASLPAGARLRQDTVGGVDGVTGANQFDARVSPDGATALLLPGRAALAWLAGDPRAQFDAAHWLPAFAGLGSAVLVGRLGAASLRVPTTLRVAAAGPAGPDLPGLLGLDLCGVGFAPIFGPPGGLSPQAALAGGGVDAVLVHGRNVPRQVAELAASGVTPIFSLGGVDESGTPIRDPQLPTIPTMQETCIRVRGAAPSGPLYDAWRAAAAATLLDAGLVLPKLTPAAMVALWRKACREASEAPDLQAALGGLGLRALSTPAATAATAPIAAGTPALLDLRRWLATRLNWHPS